MQLEELKPGLRIEGLIPAEVITVIATQWHGTDALELTYKNAAGGLGQQVVFRKDEGTLSAAQTGSRAFDATANDFKLVAEAQRITLAGLFDPMLAVATSDVQPLPHQIQAVYGELLPRTPLRFLSAENSPVRARRSWPASTSRSCCSAMTSSTASSSRRAAW